MNERIKKLRKALSLTQQEFADRISISRGAVATYEVGRNEPIDAVIASICREFNVSEKWLRTGEGDMFAVLSREDEIDNAVRRLLSGETESFKRRLILVLANLSEEYWEVLEEKLLEIAGVTRDQLATQQKDQDIEDQVNDYRQRLILEKKLGGESSQLNEAETSEKMA